MRLLLILTAAFLGAAAFAQPSSSPIYSAESMIDRSDTIFIGKVVEVDYALDRSKGLVTTLQLEETLKGDPAPRIDLSIWRTEDSLLDWKRRGMRVLVLTMRENTPAYGVDVYPLDEDMRIPKADFSFLHGEADVLEFVKRRIKLHPTEINTDYFVRPFPQRDDSKEWFANLEQSGIFLGQISGLAVPIDERLEKWGQSLIKSKDRDQVQLALGALAYFKSDRNAALIKPLLKSNFYYVDKHPTENAGIEGHYFEIRYQAAELLKRWSIPFEMPVLRVDVEAYDQVKDLQWQGEPTRRALQILYKFHNLTSLRIWGYHVGYGELSVVAQVKTLISLSLMRVEGLEDSSLAALQNMPNLRTLDLNETDLTDAGLDEIAKIKSLRNLSVAFTKVTEAGLQKLAEARPNIAVSGGPPPQAGSSAPGLTGHITFR
jgi:hypothetical protein